MAGVNIGAEPVDAMDTEDTVGDTLTYGLQPGTDAASFDIDTGSGQLQTKAALDHEDQGYLYGDGDRHRWQRCRR